MTRIRTGWSRNCLGLAAVSMAALSSCTHTVKVEPIKFEPIDITLHIYLEADQKLDSFFGNDAAPAATPGTPTTPTTPATKPERTDGGTP